MKKLLVIFSLISVLLVVSSSTSITAGNPHETIKIGVISPTTADFETLVPLFQEIIKPDINEYSAKLPTKLKFEFLVEDAMGDANVHLQKVQEFHEMGVDLIIGGSYSSQALASLSYVNKNNMLLFSPSSTYPGLAIPDDNLFRLCTDDTKQAPAIAEMLWSYGIEAVIVIQLDNVWADGIYDILEPDYENKGGVVLERIRYPDGETDFSSYLQTAEAIAVQAVATYGQEHVAIEILGFEEAVEIVTEAQNYQTIYSLPWFGSDGTSFIQEMLDEVPQIADHLKIFSTLAAPDYSLKFNEMADRYFNLVSQQLDFYSASYIDIAWIVAQAVLETRPTSEKNARDIIKVIPDIASRYYGYSGWCLLNEAGDRYTSNYDIWGYGYVDSEPSSIRYGFYDSLTGQVTWLASPPSP